jgi:hypothetical protein
MGRNKSLNAYFGSHFCAHPRTKQFSDDDGEVVTTGKRCADPKCHAVISSVTAPKVTDDE